MIITYGGLAVVACGNLGDTHVVVLEDGTMIPCMSGTGSLAFSLHDSHGFPVDLTRDYVFSHYGLSIEECIFKRFDG